MQLDSSAAHRITNLKNPLISIKKVKNSGLKVTSKEREKKFTHTRAQYGHPPGTQR